MIAQLGAQLEVLLQRFLALPRSARWLAYFAAGLLAYFVILEPALDARDRLNARADALAADLERRNALTSAAADPASTLSAARAAFGSPLLPGPESARKQAFASRVNAILREHAVIARITERQSPLRDPQADLLVEPPLRVQRLVLDLAFEAAPETVVAILADLERAPEVTAISRVQLRRASDGPASRGSSPPRVVRAQLAVETWLATRPLAIGQARQPASALLSLLPLLPDHPA